MAFDEDDGALGRDEAYDMISTDKVEGTAVYNPDGERLGAIRHLMVGKRDGRVRYAVLGFGGLLGMGERYHPLPWDVLTYQADKGGYVVDLDKDRLENAPVYEPDWESTHDAPVAGSRATAASAIDRMR